MKGALLLFVVATGCIPAVQNRALGNQIAPQRVVALPPVVMLYTMDAMGERAFEDASAEVIVNQIKYHLNPVIAASGGQVAQLERLEGCGRPCARFFRWGTVASLEIGLQRAEIQNFGLHSVADWGFGRDVAQVRAALDANFALFVMLKQMRQTSGRKVLLALGGGYTIGKQIDVACIADLRDGRMTWCATQRDDQGALAAPVESLS
jgi:hypothetical protein